MRKAEEAKKAHEAKKAEEAKNAEKKLLEDKKKQEEWTKLEEGKSTANKEEIAKTLNFKEDEEEDEQYDVYDPSKVGILKKTVRSILSKRRYYDISVEEIEEYINEGKECNGDKAKEQAYVKHFSDCAGLYGIIYSHIVDDKDFFKNLGNNHEEPYFLSAFLLLFITHSQKKSIEEFKAKIVKQYFKRYEKKGKENTYDRVFLVDSIMILIGFFIHAFVACVMYEAFRGKSLEVNWFDLEKNEEYASEKLKIVTNEPGFSFKEVCNRIYKYISRKFESLFFTKY